MKILYVVTRPLETNTSASIRNRATIEGLVECGHSVVLLTTEPDSNHPSYEPFEKPDNTDVLYLKARGTQKTAKIFRRYKLLERPRKFLSGIRDKTHIYDNYASMADNVQGIDIILDKFDCIISSSDPKSSHLLIERLLDWQGGFHGKWIQIWGDPFLNDMTLSNSMNTAKAKKIKEEEGRLLRKASKILYVSPLSLELQRREYKDSSEKMSWVPIPYLNKLVYNNKHIDESRIVLSYCGDYISSIRNIVPLYETVLKHENLCLTLCGITDLNLEQTDRIKVFPRLNKNYVDKIERESDILVDICNLSGTQVPGKIYQHAGTNKPVLVLLDGNKRQIYDAYSKYKRFVFAVNDKEDIYRKIIQIASGYFDKIDVAKPIEEFSPINVARMIIDVYSDS